MSISQLILPEFDQEIANTRKILEGVPEGDPDFAPHEKSMKLMRLAGHVAELPGWVKFTMQQEVLDLPPDFKPFIPQSRKEILETLDREAAAARPLIEKASDEDFQKTWTLKFAGKEVFSMPRYMVLRATCINHLIHHRAQLGVYLRLKEVELPGMYGPSADEMKFWQQPATA